MTVHVATSGDLVVQLRRAGEGDQGYICSTLAEQLLTANGQLNRSAVRRTIDRLLDDSRVRIMIACQPLDITRIIGWIAWSPLPQNVRTLHYIYVRDRHRHQGVARALLGRAELANNRPLVYTMTGSSTKQLLTKNPNAVYLPIEEFLT